MTLAFSFEVHSVMQCLQVTRGWRYLQVRASFVVATRDGQLTLPESSSRLRLTSCQHSSRPRGIVSWYHEFRTGMYQIAAVSVACIFVDSTYTVGVEGLKEWKSGLSVEEGARNLPLLP